MVLANMKDKYIMSSTSFSRDYALFKQNYDLGRGWMDRGHCRKGHQRVKAGCEEEQRVGVAETSWEWRTAAVGRGRQQG